MQKLFAFINSAAFVAALVVPAFAADTKSVKGEVVDLECSVSKGASGRGAAHAVCAMSCAKSGNQMAILTDDAVYLIEGDYAANKNAKLLDFVAKHVEAKGNVTENDGKKMINVAAMAVAK